MSFLRTILNFGIGIAGGKVQLAVWAIAIVGGFIFFKNHQRVVKEHAMLEQRGHDLEIQAKRAEADYQKAIALLDIELAKVAALKDSQGRERAAMANIRSQISSAFAQGFGDIASKGQTLETEIRAVPGSLLDDRIRSAIGRARSADTELARIRAAQ